MMSRKHYIELAALCSELVGGQREYVAHKLADICKRDNPRFDRDRFLAACGVES